MAHPTEQPPRPLPRRKTPFLFKFVAFLLLLAGAWLGWKRYQTGRWFNPLDRKDQQQLVREGRKDLEQAAETARPYAHQAAETAKEAVETARPYAQKALEKAKEYVQYNWDALHRLMKGKPPETKEEQIALTEESKRMAEPAPAAPQAQPTAKPQVQEPARPQPATEASKPSGPLAQAQEEMRIGCALHAKANPAFASAADVQRYIREAEPHFVKCLDLLDQARKAGSAEATVSNLEEGAARRLYDCRKRQEMNFRH